MFYKKKILIIFLLILISPVLLIGLLRFFFSTLEIEKALKSIYFKNNKKIIYFGDSVLNADHNTKYKKSSLVNIFDNTIKMESIEISGTAYNPYIYHKYFETIINYNSKIKLIIIPINLRAFSSSWMRVPEFQFEQECSFLSIINLKPDYFCIKEHTKNILFKNRIFLKRKEFLDEKVNLKGFLNSTKRKFFNDLDDCRIVNIKNERKYRCKSKEALDQMSEYLQYKKNLKHIILTLRYKYHYGEIINDDNVSLKNLKAIVALANKSNKKVLFYITPHNIEDILYSSVNRSGEEITKIMEQNLIKINEVLNGNNIYKLNLIGLLKSKHFNLKCACEHVDQQGKKSISKNISNFIITKIGSI